MSKSCAKGDARSCVTEENNQETNERRWITYDAGGNITKMETTAYSGSRSGAAVKTYAYGDTGWKDLLTSVDGQTITYVRGNPVTRNVAELDEGRLLNSYGSSSYLYDASGRRVRKTSGGITKTYLFAAGFPRISSLVRLPISGALLRTDVTKNFLDKN